MSDTFSHKIYFTGVELIEILKSIPRNLSVLVSSYESGFENFYQRSVVKVNLESYKW